jgi:aminoglycoside phosphotransferase family enzyme/adenylate kinase family enzyme
VSLIQALLSPAAYPHPVTQIQLIETHISWVLLTGQYAYKIKKNVQFDFLDFSTLDKRHFYCQEELRFNSRFAPQLYLQVVPITGSAEHPQMNGSGEIIEYAVQMQQFDDRQLLSHIADRGELSPAMIDQLAELAAEFHRQAACDTSSSHFGTPQETHHWFKGNFAHIKPLINEQTFLQQILLLEQWGEQALLNNKALMEWRKLQGFIRECHGDLHLGNITLIDGVVTPFDGIEFNPGLHWIDVISEIAFVIMDLQQRGFKQLAYRFLNRYLSASGDYAGLALLPYYLVYRALVRCKVALLRWEQHQNPQDLQEAKSYACLAENYTLQKPAQLLITHGYSGSGKSTFSAQLTEKLGMIHLRSDVERKRLIDKSQKDASNAVNQGFYTPENVLLVYHRLAELASSLLDAGFSVLIDAAFLQTKQRKLFAELAAKKQVDFVILDFYAPEEELKRRISERQKHGKDASEATIAVLEHQLETAQAFSATELDQVIQIDTCAKDPLNKLLKNKQLIQETLIETD